ncbi:glycosyltransferase [Nocardioides sp. MAH-18]|uniref:Glycosyltransferase n=1 Tax=Nocardioides agri TaxID=2682843 RepID=A0A6L6XXR0_9ACTN|nr:glycosyltransferase [Nocardioides sp. CGMCC 1.13656]MBA2955425.1 glycosyltransferase family 2 protein [Nocardioides sp. CGMCC 1.13656]MVQ50275.1 glycosyltransferase [Nocardioides sp. MAH-18]
METILVGFSAMSFVYFVLLNGFYLALTALAWVDLRRKVWRRRYLGLDDVFASPLTPGISVIVPAYNEEVVIVESVRSLLALRYPRHEVVVVNDGSADATVQTLIEAFDMVPVRQAMREGIPTAEIRATYASRPHPGLLVLDKANAGRSDALNAGFNAARHPYVCMIDADSLLEPDALLRIAKPLLDQPGSVVAAGGTIRAANGCLIDHGQVLDVRLPRSRLATIQSLEYIRAFLIARVGWGRVHALGLISGAFGIFDRSLLQTVGGLWTDTVGEDLELTLRLHRYLRDRGEPYEVVFVDDAVCWTEVPEDLTTLGRQRRRWQRGLWEALLRHRAMIGNPRYGVIGLLTMIYFAVFEFLSPIFALLGLLVTLGLWLTGGVGSGYLASFVAVSLLLGIVLSTAALVLEEVSFGTYKRRRDVLRLLAYTLLENVGYRQLHHVWRLLGFVDIARGKTEWGAQKRQGLARPVGGAD